MRGINVKYAVKLVIFTALSALLYILPKLPFITTMYEFDLSGIVIMLASFYLGPVSGVLIMILRTIIDYMIIGTETALIGEFTDVVVLFILIFPVSVIFKNFKTIKSIILSMITGVILMSLTAIILNYTVLIPMYTRFIENVSMEDIIAQGSTINSRIVDLKTFVIYATLPFNIIKGTMICVGAYVVKLFAGLFLKLISKGNNDGEKTAAF